MWLTEYYRPVFAGVSGGTMSRIGVFCRALVQQAFDEGVKLPPDDPTMAEDVGPGATIAYLFGYVVRTRVLEPAICRIKA
jgi:hypothetical protein